MEFIPDGKTSGIIPPETQHAKRNIKCKSKSKYFVNK